MSATGYYEDDEFARVHSLMKLLFSLDVLYGPDFHIVVFHDSAGGVSYEVTHLEDSDIIDL